MTAVDYVATVGGFRFFRGRVALRAILDALGISRGDEVITQAFSCVAVPEAILAVKARPVYVDIEPGGVNLNSACLPALISSRTRAIIVQHTFGIPADVSRICEIAAERKVPVIEDCCHSLDSTVGGRRVGSFGVAAFYSFEWGKPIAVGLGGSALVNDEAVRDKLVRAYAAYRRPGVLRQAKIELQYRAFRFLYGPRRYWSVRDAFRSLRRVGLAEGNYNPIAAVGESSDFQLKMAPGPAMRLRKCVQRREDSSSHRRWVASQYRLRIGSKAVIHPDVADSSNVVFARYPMRALDKRGSSDLRVRRTSKSPTGTRLRCIRSSVQNSRQFNTGWVVVRKQN